MSSAAEQLRGHDAGEVKPGVLEVSTERPDVSEEGVREMVGIAATWNKIIESLRRQPNASSPENTTSREMQTVTRDGITDTLYKIFPGINGTLPEGIPDVSEDGIDEALGIAVESHIKQEEIQNGSNAKYPDIRVNAYRLYARKDAIMTTLRRVMPGNQLQKNYWNDRFAEALAKSKPSYGPQQVEIANQAYAYSVAIHVPKK